MPASSKQSTRRGFFQAVAGLGLSFLLPGLDLKASQKRGPERAKSLLTLWMAGGPSQLETWDPHPGTLIGGPIQAIPTSIPDLKIAHFYPQVADEIHALSVIRSLVSKEGDHERATYFVKTGYPPDPTLVHPAVGAIVTHELPNPSCEIPQYITLGGGEFPSRGGFLGDEFDAFKIFDPGRNITNLHAPQEPRRQEQRLQNLDVVSQAFRQGRRIPAERTLHQDLIARALRMMTSEQLRAFELEREPRHVRAAYGDSRFGRGCLVARRLLEEGVRAIEVNLRGFDSHANNFEAHRANAAVLDPALAALLKDLKDRDLLESTVVLCIGEFGRTPKINPLDGRDHWSRGFSCLVGGGGLRAGVVLGETDPSGEKTEPSDPIEIHDLYATILKVLGVDYHREVLTPIGRPIAFSAGTPIARLL